MKKLCFIIYLLLAGAFCTELVYNTLPESELPGCECVAETKEEKKASEDYKILNPAPVSLFTGGSAAPFFPGNASLPKPCYAEIPLPPPDHSC